MKSKTEFSKMIIMISVVFLLMGLFTPLPFYIFSSAGAIGITIGWFMYMSGQPKTEDDDVIDVDFKSVNSKPLAFDEKLRKLKQLKEEELITEEEYEIKRKQIIKEKW